MAAAPWIVSDDLWELVQPLEIPAAAFTDRARAGLLVDTMILARLANPDARRVGLKETAATVLGSGAAGPEERLRVAFKHLPGRAEQKWQHVDPAHPAYWGYAAADAALTARLYERLLPAAGGLLEREMRVALVCLRAGPRGWEVDPDAADRLEQGLAAEQERLERQLRAQGIAAVSTAAGRAAIVGALEREGAILHGNGLDRGVLEPLAQAGSEVARDVLALRTIQKFRGLYAQLFLAAGERDGRLHAFPLTLATVTGRMSLPNVPLQTAPKGELELASGNGTVAAAVRGALVADDGNVCGSVDYTTMELRIAAALSNDEHLRAVVEAGDAHTATARLLFDTSKPTKKQRALAKTVNFGVLYGMGAAGLASRLRISEQEARSLVNRWWRRFAAVRRFRDRVAREERRSLWGRPLPQFDVPDHIAIHHLIQGTGRDVFAAGLLALEDNGLDEHLLLPLHDEYVLQLPAGNAAELAAEIAGAVTARLGEVELPVEWTVGSRSWASVDTQEAA
jgi:DNA polymerase-1